MIDRYTKTILTTIAAMLTVLAIQQFVKPEKASALGSSCGDDLAHACFVQGLAVPTFTVTTNSPGVPKLVTVPVKIIQ